MVKCPICGREFQNKRALGSHMRYIHGVPGKHARIRREGGGGGEKEISKEALNLREKLIEILTDVGVRKGANTIVDTFLELGGEDLKKLDELLRIAGVPATSRRLVLERYGQIIGVEPPKPMEQTKEDKTKEDKESDIFKIYEEITKRELQELLIEDLKTKIEERKKNLEGKRDREDGERRDIQDALQNALNSIVDNIRKIEQRASLQDTIMLKLLDKILDKEKEERKVQIPVNGRIIEVPESQAPIYMMMMSMMDLRKEIEELKKRGKSEKEEGEREQLVAIPTEEGIKKMTPTEAITYLMFKQSQEKAKIEEEKRKALEEELKATKQQLQQLQTTTMEKLSPENMIKVMEQYGYSKHPSPTYEIIRRTTEMIDEKVDKILNMMQFAAAEQMRMQRERMGLTPIERQKYEFKYTPEERKKKIQEIKQAINKAIEEAEKEKMKEAAPQIQTTKEIEAKPTQGREKVEVMIADEVGIPEKQEEQKTKFPLRT